MNAIPKSNFRVGQFVRDVGRSWDIGRIVAVKKTRVHVLFGSTGFANYDMQHARHFLRVDDAQA